MTASTAPVSAPADNRPSPVIPLAVVPTDLQSAARLLHQFDAGLGFPERIPEAWTRPPFEHLENTEFTDAGILDVHFRGLLRPPNNPGMRKLGEQPVLFASVGTADGRRPRLGDRLRPPGTSAGPHGLVGGW